jgi:O-antigen ligase
MKEIFYIEDTPANKISYFFLLAFLVALPFDRFYSELALIGLSLHTLIHAVTGSRYPAAGQAHKHRFLLLWPGWLVLSLFGLTMAGTLYADHPGQALEECEKQLALLLFPLISFFTGLDWKRYQLRLLKAFGLTCFFTTLYLYGAAFHSIRLQHLPPSSLFSPLFLNHAFSAPIELHATYFSMYIGLSLIVFAWLIIHSGRTWVRLAYIVVFAILFAAVIQLASRAVFIAVMIMINLLIPLFFLRKRASRRFLFASILFTVLGLLLVLGNETLNYRYIVQLKQDLYGVPGGKDGPEPRAARWDCAWELIRASPWVGHGSGTERRLLKEKYYDHHLYDSYANALNAHDQYLSLLLKSGIPGLLLYLLLLGAGFLQAYQAKDIFLGGFLVIIVLVSFSENILDVNKGLFFFSFFFSFFFNKPGTRIFIRQYGNKNTLPLMGT